MNYIILGAIFIIASVIVGVTDHLSWSTVIAVGCGANIAGIGLMQELYQDEDEEL